MDGESEVDGVEREDRCAVEDEKESNNSVLVKISWRHYKVKAGEVTIIMYGHYYIYFLKMLSYCNCLINIIFLLRYIHCWQNFY